MTHETLGEVPELEPTSFELPVGVSRIEVKEEAGVLRYTPDWNFDAFCTNVRDLAATSGKPVIATYEGEQFVAHPDDDRNTVMARFAMERTADLSILTYYPPVRY